MKDCIMDSKTFKNEPQANSSTTYNSENMAMLRQAGYRRDWYRRSLTEEIGAEIRSTSEMFFDPSYPPSCYVKEYKTAEILEEQDRKSEGKSTLPSSGRMLRSTRKKLADRNFGYNAYLHSVVKTGDIAVLNKVLSHKSRRFIEAPDRKGNTLLHTAAGGGQKYVVKFLLSKGANIFARNAEGKTPRQVTSDPDTAGILNEHFSKLLKSYANSLRRINVPEENNYLFWSVTLAYLYPVRYEDVTFRVRFKNLFGYTEPDKTLEDVQRLIQNYYPTSRKVNIHKNSLMSILVKRQSRRRFPENPFPDKSLLDILTVMDFLGIGNENYFTSGTFQGEFYKRFETEIEKYNIDLSKLQPYLLNGNTLRSIADELNKVPDQKAVKGFLYETYKHYSQNSDPTFGYMEIQAISLKLGCNIIVFSGEDNKAVTHLGGDYQIYLFDKGGGSYDFGLVRAEELIKAVTNGETERVEDYLRVGIDNINHKHTGGWTVLHFAAERGYSEIFPLLVKAGGKTTATDLLNQTPSDVGRAFGKSKRHVTESFPSTQHFGLVSFDSEPKPVPVPRYGQSIPSAEYFVERATPCRELRYTELLMFLFLRGLQKEMEGKITEFCLHSVEHRTCIDIIFRFKYKKGNETEKSKIMCLQTSLRTSDKETISVKELFSDSDTTIFSLKRYLKFYRDIKHQFLDVNQNSPLFGSAFGDLDCDFVMYTDAPTTFEEDDNKSTIKVPIDPEDIFFWGRENTHYWKLNIDETKKATDILQNSSECSQLAKELLMCVFHPEKGNDSKQINILEKYRHPLNAEVIIGVEGKADVYVFREIFLDPDEIFFDEDKENMTFREALFEEGKKIYQKSKSQLKLYLRGKYFRIPFQFWKPWKQELWFSLPKDFENVEVCDPWKQERQFALPNDFISDSEIKVLLTKLKFFVCQPDQIQLYEIIKQKIRNMYSLDKSDIEVVFSSVKRKIEELCRGGRTHITQRDIRFENYIKIPLFSKVKNLDRVHKLVNSDSSDCLEGNDKGGLVLFHFAVGAGHLDIVKFLVREGFDINQGYFSQETALYNAVRNNHYSIVSFFVKNKAQVNVVNERGESPLHLAVSLGRTEIVKLLTNEDISINVPDEDGNTPLHYAAKQGNLAIVKILLEKGSTVDAFDNKGKTALQVAIEALEDNFDIVSYLAEQKATLTSVDNDGLTLLHSAACSNKLNVIELLLREGIEVNARNYQGQTPLHLASMSSSKEAIKSLLKKGANIHAVDCDGRTFLDAANEETKESITSLKEYNATKLNPWSEYTKLVNLLKCAESAEPVRSLLEKQTIDINAVSNEDRETVLFPAVRKGDEELVKLFLDKGADTYITNHIQETVLHVASRTGNKKVVQLLLCRDIDFNRRNCSGETALHEASRVGDEEMVRILFEKVQKVPEAVNNKTALGDTALHNAAINGHLEVVEFLLANSAEMNCRNFRGETPLHFASVAGGKEVVRSLVKHGANIQARNYEGNAPLHVAAQKGKQEVIEILLEGGAEIDARNFNRETPLHLASNKEVVRMLIKGGADINAKTSQTSLHFYARNGKISNIRELLINAERMGESVEECVCAQDDAGTQPIHLAAREGHKDVVALLLQNGASVDAEDHSGLRPMHLAANEGHMDVIRLLLETQGDVCVIEAQDNCGMQPIHLAAREGHRDVVEFFLKKKKSLKDIKSASEVTPLHLASRNLHVTTVGLLLNKNANTEVEDILGQTVLHHFASGLYTRHKELVSRAVEFITVMRARLLKDQSSAEQIYLERVSASTHKELLTSQVAKTKLSTICGFNTISDIYLALQQSAVKSADAAENFFKGESCDICDIHNEIINQIKKITDYQNATPYLEVVLFFPKCLLYALDESLSTFLVKSGTVSEKHFDAKERLLTDFAKLLAEYNDYVDDIIYTKKEALENLTISEKRTCFINGMRELSNKLHENVNDNTGCNFRNSAFLSDILEDYVKLTDPKCSKAQRDSEKPIEKLCIQRALQVAGDKQTIEMLKEHLDDETSAALKVLRHNYLSHLDERSNCFARVMTEYKVDAFNVAEDLDLIIKDLATGLKRKIKLQKIEILWENLTWLSGKDKELQDIAKKLQKREKEIKKGQLSILEAKNRNEICSLNNEINELKKSVRKAICGRKQTVEFESLIEDELERYCNHVVEDNSSGWKFYLCIPFFYRRLQLLRNEVLKDSLIGENLRKTFTYTVNQKPVEKTITFLKKYKKSLAGTEFLIYELRNILTDTFRNSKEEFDKKVREKLDSMVGNRSLRNHLAHIAHGSRLCHALTDLARVVAYDAHMFMDKGKAVTAFEELSFRIKKDGKKWNEDNKSKVLFTELIDCNYRVELLNALKDITGDVTMLGDEIEKFLGNLNDSEFKSMMKKCEERVELLKIFRDATASSQKEKLKTKFKGYLKDLSVEEFTEILVAFSKQNDFLEIVEKITGPKTLAKEVKKYLSNRKLRFKEIKKSENFEDLLIVLRRIAQNHQELSELLERQLRSCEIETSAPPAFRNPCLLI